MKNLIMSTSNNEQLEREVARVGVEAKAMFEWNFGYKECSAKLGIGINEVSNDLY